MSHRLLLSGIVAIGIADGDDERGCAALHGRDRRDPRRLRARRSNPRLPPLDRPDAAACEHGATMRKGEAVAKEVARLASRAILYRRPGVALTLQRAGDAL